MGHSSTDVLREHYHYIFEGAGQRGRTAIASMLTPGADDPTEGRAEVAWRSPCERPPAERRGPLCLCR